MPSSHGHDWVSVSLVQWLLTTLPSLVTPLSAILGMDEWVTVAVVSVETWLLVSPGIYRWLL